MNKDGLKHAIALHDTIERLDTIEAIFESKRWPTWGMNERFGSTHFSLLKHYGNDSDEIVLPEELNESILKVISDYNKKIKKEFEKL